MKRSEIEWWSWDWLARVRCNFFRFELLEKKFVRTNRPRLNSCFATVVWDILTKGQQKQYLYVYRTRIAPSLIYTVVVHIPRGCTCALPSPSGAKISPAAGVKTVASGGMSRLSELLWLPNGHNTCLLHMSITLNASSTPPLSLNLKCRLRSSRTE